MYRLLVQGVTDYAIYMLDRTGRVSNWNAGAERAKGYRAEEIVGRDFACFYSAEDQRSGLPGRGLAEAREVGRFQAEGWRYRKDGSRFWAYVVIDAIHDDDGSLIGFTKITRDCTDQKNTADALARTTANLDMALAHMSQGLCFFDADGRLVLCNLRFRRICMLPPALSVPGTALRAILRHVWRLDGGWSAGTGHGRRAWRHAFTAKGDAACELLYDNRVLAVQTRVLPNGGWVSTVEDITGRRQIENRILHMAQHDALTELPNRATFCHRLDQALAPASGIAACAVLFLDLDRFKPVNDTMGHLAGDQVLKEVAARILRVLRRTDTVARLGGDEFAIIQVAPEDPADTAGLADRLVRELGRPITVHRQQVTIGVSIGIAMAPADGQDSKVLLRNADLALYRAKQDGRNCYRYYQSGMDQIMLARQKLERDLRQALRLGEFELHYQPILELSTGRIGSFEALIRWNSPSRGRVAPNDFIVFAEEIGLMPEIGAWVLDAACREAASWPEEIKVSVNVSASQFGDGRLAGAVEGALRASGLAPARLELEITETAMIGNLEVTVATLRAFAAMGIGVAMDDFGTGYSSLSFLRSFPFTRIKIDQSFVRGLGHDPQSDAIVRAVTGLCDSLGVAATAEGVETEEQRDILRRQNCTAVQGYFISRPQPAHALPAMIQAQAVA
jgi:diguanylate cyclase (GGDEF)-like protein/PAS domain S-box-containing protein